MTINLANQSTIWNEHYFIDLEVLFGMFLVILLLFIVIYYTLTKVGKTS